MGRPMNVAVAGATGAVGVEMLETLEKRNFPVASIKLLASARSAGKKMKFRGGEITIEEMKPESFKGVDIALFSAGSDVSKQYRQACADAGCVMIDNSSAFRMDDDVPLVIPEINPEDAFKHHGVIANPNCTTAIMAVAVYPLHKAKGLKRLIASTYQAASGGGAPAMQELLDQTREVLNGAERVEPKVMAQQIAFNLFPHIDSFQPNGYTKEELKMVNETRKIMHIPDLMLTCTSVRVPIMRAHSESLNLEFEQEITPEEAREILSKAPGVIVRDDPANKVYPMPIDATGKFDVIVGRIRQDISRNDKRGLEIFVSGDQLLKGAALNAVQIAEVLSSK
ncbi:MAG: aspartate-semialdehyde dehydrogenase [Victivallales bacterium]